MENFYRHLSMPPELAIEFMAVFSRAEHALKSAEFAIGDEGKVAAAWDKYANEIHEEFEGIEEISVVEASKYLLEYPPRKQVLVENKVEFREQKMDKNQKRTQQIFLMVRAVRNNLFHGGKYLLYGEREEGRNEKLVQASLSVLEAGIFLNEKVRASFEH